LRLAKLATLLGGVTLLWACNAPPIVVPPPVTPEVLFTSQLLTDASGQQKTVWTGSQPIQKNDYADARFFIFDLNLGAGVIQTAGIDGTFATTPAWAGTQEDRISIYFTNPDGISSESICRLLREGPSAAPCGP
jgi:hypothetical protein